MNTILIIDGDGLLARSHFAVGKEILANGIEVGGMDKFIHVLRRQIRNWDADAVYIAFDPSGGTTFRHKLYAQYKAGRPPKPEGLIKSKEQLPTILEAMGATTQCDPEHEADDLVASMNKQAADAGWRSIVSSHDKDLGCLLANPNTVLAPPFQMEPTTRESMHEKLGIYPEQVIDYLALMGDAVDNIPGIDHCGKGKAAMLLDKYYKLEEVLAAATRGEISKKMGESLRLHHNRTLAFRDLMILRENAKIPSLGACAIRSPEYNTLLPLLLSNNLSALYAEAKSDSGV